jgi:arylsulfatase A-like enzyme
VASFVNPHDIAFAGGLYELLLGGTPTDDTVPEIPEPPSQPDSFAGRPGCQEQFKGVWPQMVAAQPADLAYRQLYYYLHKLVDRAIGRILEELARVGLTDDTIIVFTSDHGDLLGAHGGLQQKWHNAFDEATRVPFVVKGPGIASAPGGLHLPTSHVDLLPTLLGLAGIDTERATAGVAAHHDEAQPLPGRDLSGVLTGAVASETLTTPIYFMTEDEVSRGITQTNVLTGAPFEAVGPPAHVESVIAELATGDGGATELWKLNHYYERLDDWYEAHGVARNAFLPAAAEPEFEVHNLTRDPEERHNLAADADAADTRGRLLAMLESERDAKRRLPNLRNPAS